MRVAGALRHGAGGGVSARRLLAFACLVLGLAAVAADPPAPGGSGLVATARGAETGAVRVIRIDAIINPIVERYLVRNLEEAERAGDVLLVVELNTPGGLLDATQQITGAMLGSRVPIAVYVSPDGARAASAGVFITIAGHVAAMAPSTRMGAATPVDASGGDIEDDLRNKIINDTVVYGRSLADARGRNADWVERAIREAVVVSATEAVDLDVADLVAPDRRALLAAIDGRTVTTAEGEETLATANAPVQEHPLSIFEQFLMAIADPNIALLLLSLGGIALYFELANPGAMIPGIVGVIFLLLAFLSLGTLPISAAGLALIVLGLILLGAELFVASGGILAVGGVAAFALGAIALIDETRSPFLEVSRPLIVGLTVTLGGFVLVALRGVVRARRRPVAIGEGELPGRLARVRGRGQVWVAGELWQARTAGGEPLEPGREVRIVAREGLSLVVEPIEREDGREAERGGDDSPPSPRDA